MGKMDFDEQVGRGAGKYLLEMSNRLAKIPEDWRDAAIMRADGKPDDEIKKQYGFTDKQFDKILSSPEFQVIFNQRAMSKAQGYLGPAIDQMGHDAKQSGNTRAQEGIMKITGLWRDKKDVRVEAKSQQMILHGNLSDLSKMHPHEACKEMLINIRDELGIGRDVLIEYVNEVYIESTTEG